MRRHLWIAPFALLGCAFAFAVATVGSAGAEDPAAPANTVTVTVTVETERACGPRARPCSVEYRTMRRIAYLRLIRSRQLARTVRFDPQYRTALDLACTTLRATRAQCNRADSIMTCEAGHRGVLPSPRAKNPNSTAKGLGQFLDSTWEATRFGLLDVFDPYVNAMAVVEWVKAGLSWVHWSASASCWEPLS